MADIFGVPPIGPDEAADLGAPMNKVFSPKSLSASTSNREREAAWALRGSAFENAASQDCDGAFPESDICELRRLGFLAAPLPRALGGVEPDGLEMAEWLRHLGAGSLPLGRLYEGHVNALGLILRYGNQSQSARMAREAREGQLCAVWNTDDGAGLRLIHDGPQFRLAGRKILASGAGRILRPLVTATDERGRRLMVTPLLGAGGEADLSRWTAHGMRASATGSIDLSGVVVSADEIVGEDGDYERQPFFSGGAWRFCAVQQGAMETLFELLRRHLISTGRGGDPHQMARVGQAGIAVETAHLWVERAARLFEENELGSNDDRVVAYVNLARLAVERAGLDLMELVQRSVGLQGFMRPHPIERICRDLSTYLRQPAPDRALASAAGWMLGVGDGAADIWSATNALV
jgi:alkylation response protein AidB-like acyl-CoA dehydrogenase